MRTLVHRRHSQRDPGGIHLNSAGRALARRVAAEYGTFDRVVTSPRPRARETAEAMGQTVDAELATLAEMPDDAGISPPEPFPRTFSEYAATARRSTAAAEYAHRQANVWRDELARVPDGGGVLMISHGGAIEFGAVAALPGAAVGWGASLGYLEGVRLEWDGEKWTTGAVLRVSDGDVSPAGSPSGPARRPRRGSPWRRPVAGVRSPGSTRGAERSALRRPRVG